MQNIIKKILKFIIIILAIIGCIAIVLQLGYYDPEHIEHHRKSEEEITTAYENCRLEKDRSCLFWIHAGGDTRYLHLSFYITLQETMLTDNLSARKSLLLSSYLIADQSQKKDRFDFYQKIGNYLCTNDPILKKEKEFCENGKLIKKW